MRICFIGDSFVNGTNDPLYLGWSGRVAAQAMGNGRDLTHYNLGIRRDTSLDIADRWHDEAARRLPTGIYGRLVFSFGVNDCVEENGRQRIAPDVSVASARRIFEHAREWKPVLMVGPPPIASAETNQRIGGLSTALAGLCAELGISFLDIFTPLSASPVWRRETAANDGAHPGAVGYEILAALVSDWPAWRAWMDQPR